MTPVAGNNNRSIQRRLKGIFDRLYDFLETYGLDFVSVIVAATGLVLYETSRISPEAIGRWTLAALLAITLSNMRNRGSRLSDIKQLTEESTNLVREHLDGGALEENISRAIDAHVGKVDKWKMVGIVTIFEGLGSGQIKKRAYAAEKSIRILDTWTGQLDQIIESLRDAACRKVKIKILLLSPNSQQAGYRTRDLFAFKNVPLSQGKESIRNELIKLSALCKDDGVKDYIEVRMYDATPTASIYGFDDTNIVGTYWRKLSSVDNTHLEVMVPREGLDSVIATAVDSHFNDLWDNSEKLTDESLQAALEEAPKTPAVDALQDAIKQGTEEYKDKPAQMSEFMQEQVRKLPELQAMLPAPDSPDLSGHRILWVDDHPINNALELHALKKLRIEDVIQVNSTEEARGILRKSDRILRRDDQGRFDLIISDINRDNNPNAGYELFDQIKTDPALSLYRDVPFIFYSDSIAHADARIKGMAYGATDKPDELIDLVTCALQGIEVDEESA